MAFDEGGIYMAYQGGEDDVLNEKELIVERFKQFIKEFFSTDGERNYFPYREALLKNKTCLRVDLFHVKQQQPELGLRLQEQPADLLPLFERAAREVLRDDHHQTAEGEDWTPPQVQVLLFSSRAMGPASIRQLSSQSVSHLIQIPGIITAASRPKHKANVLVVQCKHCHALERVPCRPGLGGALVPGRCNTYDGSVQPRCPPNPYVVVGERCEWVDQQTLKLQERPEDIPTGELPRTLTLVADRHLVNRVTPGTRVRVTGIYSVTRGGGLSKGAPAGTATLQQPYLRLVDISEESEGHKEDDFSAEEVARFTALAREEGILAKIQASIAPKIFGAQDIKKAVACLLFGGCRKIMPDGTARRGDINVLLLGDPSTAKSQFLKFVDKVAPICVYTSGKGSSAAGLTAAVVQDANSREFFLEGGAMVLADGGVVCIDEFDKMRPEDRVAIHEAMEQQTISIAKAGITTVLKSRTSVLAAANPPAGRYDDYQSTADNIDLQSTILSRFDLIFVVRDLADTANDQRIADFVLGTHREAVGAAAAADGGAATGAAAGNSDVLSDALLKRYIHYARCKCFPRLNAAAARKLQQKYVEIRDKARQVAQQDDEGVPPVPIGVRQLEALVRLSESFARMALCREAGEAHVDLAMDLFNRSTMNAMEAGVAEPSTLNRQPTAEAEGQVREHIPLNGHLSFQRLMERLQARGYSAQQSAAAIKAMVGRGELRRRAEGKLLQRVR